MLQYHLKITCQQLWMDNMAAPKDGEGFTAQLQTTLSTLLEAIWAIQRSDQPTAAAMDKALDIITADYYLKVFY